jgi:serine/threonine protein kinase
MSAPATVDEFLELAGKSQLLEQQSLLAYLERRRTGSAVPDSARAMAEAMVKDGLLTWFQAQQLMLGRWRNFDLNGKYRILGPIGSGGMGQVYLCEHMVMRRRVAVKVLPLRSSDHESLERFRREARAVARLHHSNIVTAYDIDQAGQTSFLVMEYIDGSTFRQIVSRTGPMDYVRACHYIRQAALGLQHAHEAGLVHRDIKPSNLLLDRTGTVKILDLGLARFFHEDSDELSKPQMQSPLGTTDYMAPEQALDSHQADIRADIYSLGATFYFLLAGHRPFQEGSDLQKLIWHQIRKPQPIREIRADVPEALAAVIDRMMAKAPTERYQSPAEVARALTSWVRTRINPPAPEEMPQLASSTSGGSYPDAPHDLPVSLYGSESTPTNSTVRQQGTDEFPGLQPNAVPVPAAKSKAPTTTAPRSQVGQETSARSRPPSAEVKPYSVSRSAPVRETRTSSAPRASAKKSSHSLRSRSAKKPDQRNLVIAAVGAGLLLGLGGVGFAVFKLAGRKEPEVQEQASSVRSNVPAQRPTRPAPPRPPADKAPHEVNLAAAWAALKEAAHPRAIAEANKCIAEFQSAAQEMEDDLARRDERFPTGAVDEATKKRILNNGPLNDVAACLWIKGQSAEAQGDKELAVEAYRSAERLPHARCWDPQGWFWSPAEKATERLEVLR